MSVCWLQPIVDKWCALPVSTGAVEYALCTRVTLGRRMQARCCCHPQRSPPSSVHVCDTTHPTRCSSLFNNKGLPIPGQIQTSSPLVYLHALLLTALLLLLAGDVGSADGREITLSVFTTSAGDQCWRTSAVLPSSAEVQQSTGGSPRSAPRKVVGQWLVSSSVPEIEISRTLRVRVHRVPEIRVEIPNAYQVAKTFKLHTDRPELLGVLPAPGAQHEGASSEHRGKEVSADPRVRHELTVAARSKQSVTWAVRVTAGERAERALLFVTDEHDKIEETIELWLEISPMPASVTASSASSPAAGACMSSLPSLSA